jgi:hypothetical protein
MPATIDGSAVLGFCVSIKETPHANAQQYNEYFGISGEQSLFGGQRGRSFTVSGLVMASDFGNLESIKEEILSFADGLTHTLVDTLGNTWFNVILTNEWEWTGIPRPTFASGFGTGIGRPYTLKMRGIT